jgi:predicted ester cyclase
VLEASSFIKNQFKMDNKEFINRYFKALTTEAKSKEVLENYITDKSLLEHIAFFESAFPDYKVIADEMTAEGNRVVVQARFTGVHEGDFNGIPPTHRSVEVPFAIGYEIENNKIVHHWIIVDRLALMEQLGVVPKAEAAH